MAGKKHKEDKKSSNLNIPNRDIMQRLNFLYQASVYLNQVSNSGGSTTNAQTTAGTSTRSRENTREVTTSDIAKDYVKTMKLIGTKVNIRMDPSVKRTICKSCSTILVPGSTARVRVRTLPSHKHAVVYVCTTCSTPRRIPAPPTNATDDASNSLTKDENKRASMETAVEDGDTQDLEQQHASRKRFHPTPFFAKEGHLVVVGN